MMDTVLKKLNLTADQINALFSTGQVGGYRGADVALKIANRYQLTLHEPFGRQLAEQGVLTKAEGRWLDDLD